VVDTILPSKSWKEITSNQFKMPNQQNKLARKTFASPTLLNNDFPIEVVGELLWDSSIEITQEYYGKIVQNSISEEMRRISKNLYN